MTKKLKIEHAKGNVHPKLRVIANGDTAVNIVRAEHAASVRVTEQVLQHQRTTVGEARIEGTKDDLSKVQLETRKLTEPPDVELSVFVQLVDSGPDEIEGITARAEDLVTAEVSVTSLAQLENKKGIAYVEPGETLSAPNPVIDYGRPRPPFAADRRVSRPGMHGNGREVLIGLIDVEGFDFSHPDFLTRGKTRFDYIWDQSGSARTSPRMSRGGDTRFQDYGAEFSKAHLDAAMDASAEQGLAPWLLEPQSQRVPGSHGTHVASIAAGNRGLCRSAHIAGVVLALDPDAADRRNSFYDSTRIAHAVDYLFAVATELGGDSGPLPVSINISLGTNGHAHDASSAVSRWIDYALTVPGRSVCVAAGNSGQAIPEVPGDLGFIMGRIHTRGQFTATGLQDQLEWTVVGNGRADVSENELEIWYGAQDRFSVELKPPGGSWIGPVHPGQYVQNHRLPSDAFISIYNDLYYPANGANRIAIYLSPFFSTSGNVIGIPSGTWLVRINADEVRDGSYHAWIERDDPRRIGMIGPLEAWRFPSFFSDRTYVDDSTVSSLACGQRIISVANYHDERRRINTTSSEGPTRDGRNKPDIAAPGTDIVAARGFSASSERWISMSGTSMASPYVAGVVGLMLATDPGLTAAQIGGIIRRTARPLPGCDYSWQKDSGYGLIDANKCINETIAFRDLPSATTHVGSGGVS